MRRSYRLGINHHLLFPATMTDALIHEATLPEVLAYPEFQVIDLFLAGDETQRRREAALIRDSGRAVVYNCPLFYLIESTDLSVRCDPNSTDEQVMHATREAALLHLDAAAEVQAELINIASGPNPDPAGRDAAWHGWIDFLTWFGNQAAQRRLRAVIEPFDQSIGKNLLIGPTADAVKSVEAVRERGVDGVGLMVDMGHLPIMGESFATGVRLSAPYLWHVHLGSAVIRHPEHPLYGDCHPPLGLPEGEHGVAHFATFLHELNEVGYFADPRATLTLEMRPYDGKTPRESVNRWLAMLDSDLVVREAWELWEKGTI